MQQFLLIVAVHFLALLSPGPDFFLIARTSLRSGWRIASGVCLGIALANGTFIVIAFSGMAALQSESVWYIALQLAGATYLLYLGALFLRHAGHSALNVSVTERADSAPSPSKEWLHAAGMGFLSGVLNPKNALFYASIAAMLNGSQTNTGWKFFYGTWMFFVVLVWDLMIAMLIGNSSVLLRFSRALPWIERTTGMFMILLALGVFIVLLR